MVNTLCSVSVLCQDNTMVTTATFPYQAFPIPIYMYLYRFLFFYIFIFTYTEFPGILPQAPIPHCIPTTLQVHSNTGGWRLTLYSSLIYENQVGWAWLWWHPLSGTCELYEPATPVSHTETRQGWQTGRWVVWASSYYRYLATMATVECREPCDSSEGIPGYRPTHLPTYTVRLCCDISGVPRLARCLTSTMCIL